LDSALLIQSVIKCCQRLRVSPILHLTKFWNASVCDHVKRYWNENDATLREGWSELWGSGGGEGAYRFKVGEEGKYPLVSEAK
jgi:hypothetical protein